MPSPYEDLQLKPFPVKVTTPEGETLIDEEVLFPEGWDYNDVQIVASRYLCNSAKKKEKSFLEMVERVSRTLANWCRELYRWDEEQTERFYYKLAWYQAHRYLAFNSPVYFNVGLKEAPQCSACFILGIEDSMESIYDVLTVESRIFKWGSGSGYNISPLRSKHEPLSGGGYASGPVSFMKLHATSAEVVRSGGRLRRAAKLVCLDADHPDIEEFVTCKVHEEKKARALMEAGLIQQAFGEVYLQSVNISVRVTDSFMRAALEGRSWPLRFRVSGKVYKEIKARELFKSIAKAAWETGDPGLQFHDTVNRWNTVEETIVATNPCSEYNGPNWTSCNLASLNLTKFLAETEDGRLTLDVNTLRDCIETAIYAMTAICYKAYYPDPRIEKATHRYAALGLGYTNLGALLILLGEPYGSLASWYVVNAVTALMHGLAWRASQKVAKEFRPYEAYDDRRHWPVMEAWRDLLANNVKEFAARAEAGRHQTESLQFVKETYEAASHVWEQIFENRTVPFANSQVTLLAPTGTISFIMGASTFGIEPMYSHVAIKHLMDGGRLNIIPPVIEEALRRFGYRDDVIKAIKETAQKEGRFASELLQPEDRKVFKVAVAEVPELQLTPNDHLVVASAAQQFLSGAISKTINLPNSATPEDIEKVYIRAWELGLKGVTIYRDGSKVQQALTVAGGGAAARPPKPAKYYPLPANHPAKVHKFRIGQSKGRIITGMYDDGTLGEIYLYMGKAGSTLAGILDAWAITFSLALQHGVPLETIARKLMGRQCEPSGFTDNPKIKTARSLVDYIAKYLLLEYGKAADKDDSTAVKTHDEGILCQKCGNAMVRRGKCYYCTVCGETTGTCE